MRYIKLSSGKTHDQINFLATSGILTLGLITQSGETIYTGLGIGLGTIFLSPDLDLSVSNPTNRLGPFSILLLPYRLMCGHHRSFVSHSPIVSSLIRVLYFLSPFVIWSAISNQQAMLTKVTLSPEFFWILVGLEIATDIHLFLDFQYSFFKKLRKN